MHPATPRNQRKTLLGFTLIELVVVIVILGILAAIAVVGYGAVTTKSTSEVAERSAEIVAREAIALAAFDNTPAGAGQYQTAVTSDASSNVTFDGTDTLTISVAGTSCTVTFTDLTTGAHGPASCAGGAPTTTAPGSTTTTTTTPAPTTTVPATTSTYRLVYNTGTGGFNFTAGKILVDGHTYVGGDSGSSALAGPIGTVSTIEAYIQYSLDRAIAVGDVPAGTTLSVVSNGDERGNGYDFTVTFSNRVDSFQWLGSYGFYAFADTMWIYTAS